MKLKYIEMLNSIETLNRLNSMTFEKDVVTALKIARNIKRIGQELATYNEIKDKLLNRYGIAENEGKFKIKPENVDVFAKEMNKLLQEEADVEILMFPVESLPLHSPEEIFPIEWMIEM